MGTRRRLGALGLAAALALGLAGCYEDQGSNGYARLDGPMGSDHPADDLGVVHQPAAPPDQRPLQPLQVVEPRVGHRLAHQRPERLGRLQLRRARRQSP